MQSTFPKVMANTSKYGTLPGAQSVLLLIGLKSTRFTGVMYTVTEGGLQITGKVTEDSVMVSPRKPTPCKAGCCYRYGITLSQPIVHIMLFLSLSEYMGLGTKK